MDCPVLIWMLYTNREMTDEEFRKCFTVMKECVLHANVQDNHTPDATRQVISFLLPLLMMRHRRVPRARWRDNTNPNSKHWIEQIPTTDNENPVQTANRMRSMIGYHLAWEHNLVGMAMTQGRQRDVVNIGIGIKEITSPAGMSVVDFAISHHHKLTVLEQSFIKPELGDEVILRRLCLLLALKAAYIKAIGQPMGFDWSRLEFNIPERSAKGDNTPLNGWEFRVWQAQVGGPVMGQAEGGEEDYQCAAAFFRGQVPTKFIWQTDAKELESWVQFITLEQLLNVVDRLVE